MSGSDEEKFNNLRESVGRLLAADRRLRSRDQHKGEGLQHSHLRAMFVLMREERATAGTLAKQAELNPASVTAMVDQLEARGLTERSRDPEDRRQWWISLTDAGRAAVEAKQRHWTNLMAEAFADVTDRELQAADKVLERIAGVLEGLSSKPIEIDPATSRQ